MLFGANLLRASYPPVTFIAGCFRALGVCAVTPEVTLSIKPISRSNFITSQSKLCAHNSSLRHPVITFRWVIGPRSLAALQVTEQVNGNDSHWLVSRARYG